jgi:hypothetical protein
MKLSILYESRNPKQPTDLTLVATQTTKDGAMRGKYPVNFYSGKIGYKSSGKVVLGYHDKDDKFKTTGPIVGIVQSKKAPDRWLIKTINDNRPAYYNLQMPEATVMSTYNRYLKGTASTPIPIYTYDQNTKKHINKKDTRRRANEGWSYYNGTTISKSNMPTRKPKTSVEAYDYLMYWAFHNNQLQSAADAIPYYSLIAYLLGGKRLSKGIRDVVAAFPNARHAVTKRLKYLEEKEMEDREFELNLDDDTDTETVEKPEATPAPKPEPEPEPNNASSDLQAEEDAVQNTTADDSSALDQDTHQGQVSDSGSVEMPASESQRADHEEAQASPEVKKANSDKFIKLIKQLFSLDPIDKPKRTLKAATEFMGFLGMPALWGKCYEGGPGQWLDGYIEDYARMCKVKAFWVGDSKRDQNRRDAEWLNMTKNDRSYMSYHRDSIDQKVTDAKTSFTSELAKHITKIRSIYPDFSL